MTDETSAEDWVPLHLRGTEGAAQHAVLAEGIPAWLEASVFRWVADRAAQGGQALAFRAEQRLKINLHPGGLANSRSPINEYWVQADETQRLTLVNYILRDLQERHDAAEAGEIDDDPDDFIMPAVAIADVLDRAGSAWTFAIEPFWGLSRRVNDTTAAQAAAVSSPNTDAAKRIGEAWSACYRHGPDYDAAYWKAVLAVEAVVFPVTISADDDATLGKAIAHIRDTRQKWTVGDLDSPKAASVDTLLAMLDLLWRNQQRHAGKDGTIRDVTGPEAETAVNLAVTLVQWFTAGLVRRTG